MEVFSQKRFYRSEHVLIGIFNVDSCLLSWTPNAEHCCIACVMSSKLVKQQLASLINSGVSSKKSSKKNKKRVVKRAHDASQEQPIVESNLKYYKKTKGPDGNTKELLEKV